MVRYLVRQLTLIYKEGRVETLPLVIISGYKNGNVLSTISIYGFQKEEENVEYFNEMALRENHDSSWDMTHRR